MNKRCLLVMFGLFCNFANIFAAQSGAGDLGKLPHELVVYLAPMIGNNLIETLQGITKLSLTNKAFNTLIKNNKALISSYLKDRFGEREILGVLDDVIRKKQYKEVGLLLNYDLIGISDIIHGANHSGPTSKFYIEMIKYLLKQNKISKETFIEMDNEQFTPIGYVLYDMVSTDSGPAGEIINYFLEKDFDPDKYSKANEKTNLEAAMEHGIYGINIFKMLVEHKANLFIKNKYGLTVLDLVAANSQKRSMELYVLFLKDWFEMKSNRRLIKLMPEKYKKLFLSQTDILTKHRSFRFARRQRSIHTV